MSFELLPVIQASRLENKPEEKRWLIESIWADQAVGIIGGEPKCCKSFLALDVAVSVASGRPCLRRFPVSRSGRVLLYAAEDALHVVRKRLEGIAEAASARLQDLDIQVITAPVLRLDRPEDVEKLRKTVEKLRPSLLVLDPFVRLHRIDENNSGEVAPILANLREIQRTYELAIIVVHHAKKGGANERAGQALRGSSEFHAWGDSNLYLRRNKDEQLTLTIEQRAEASHSGVRLELKQDGLGLGLHVIDGDQANAQSGADHPPMLLPERVLSALASSEKPMSLRALREQCRSRTASISAALDQLVSAGQVAKTPAGYAHL
jgi:RecA-family ATPase